ncbi:MAG: TlyA family rRNA (cytidine-2'-O)-methyltransferase [candidate division Zixibacteria bacterium]|nr:TlyA family rRNA (cytidine-2'-O)-methyltransferase [candidate division Zixibacteria bacterium]
MRKRRLDEILVARGLAPSQARAAALIMAGKVAVDGRLEFKAGAAVGESADVVVAARPRYASRGGDKLAFALDRFGVDVAGEVCLDVGASSGGFTSCLLARGAAHVHALDVGRGLLAWSLRNDPRVTIWEKVNARRFDGGVLEPAPSVLVVDVSFISISKVLRPLVATLAVLEEVIALVKPQFEARRDQVGRGGVVRDAEVHKDVLTKAVKLFDEIGLAAVALAASPLEGPAGNREFFLRGVRGAEGRDLKAEIAAVVTSEEP